jgi:hypothetical protein
MSKKKIEEKVLGPEDKFYPGDKDEILRLARVVYADHNDMTSIYNLYKKYINGNAPMYKTDCNCPTSIGSYFNQLLDWYSENWK